ncbi:hypothetical protein BZG01_16980 [Labilibaculum manganireducens]|uniref:DUF4890 domain-containing protein n=1 Tax=Labilibaculum manganireducens TaxID=1940525 RepID=A0A2N3HXA9_9BACT|nr:hypothetical protein [Labilibaculum manganireducens]PKQ62671.1 hypothetical protein BZG01_16980 [Labilibaculum manganireducens]
MRIIKLTIILRIAVMMLLDVNFAQAQQRDQQGPPPIPDASQIKTMVMKLSGTLVLNDVQSKQMYDLFTAHFEELSAKIESSNHPRSEMEALKTKFETEVKSILTTEQQKQFEVFMKQNEPKHRPHHSQE